MADDRLARRLRDYEDRLPDADPPDGAILAGARRGTHWRLLAATGGASVAVAAIVLLNTLPNRPVDVAPAASSSSAGPAATSDASTAAPRPSAATIFEWTEGGSFEGRANDVVWRENRWLAGGAFEDRAAVWQSVDGSSWEQVPPIAPEPAESEYGLSTHAIAAFAEWHGRLVATGPNRLGSNDSSIGALWMSRDGITWDYMDPATTSVGTDGQWPVDVLGTPGGGLLVLDSVQLSSRTQVHTTPDGAAWSTHLLGGPEFGSTMQSVAASPDRIVGVGGSARLGVEISERVMTIWESRDDGVTWTPVLENGLGGSSSVAYDAFNDRFVAGGQLETAGVPDTGQPAVLVSSGATWTPVTLSAERGSVLAVASAGGVLLAAGQLHDTGKTVVWESRDGVEWTMTELADLSVSPRAFGVVGDRSVVLIVEARHGQDPPMVRTWTAAIEP